MDLSEEAIKALAQAQVEQLAFIFLIVFAISLTAMVLAIAPLLRLSQRNYAKMTELLSAIDARMQVRHTDADQRAEARDQAIVDMRTQIQAHFKDLYMKLATMQREIITAFDTPKTRTSLLTRLLGGG